GGNSQQQFKLDSAGKNRKPCPELSTTLARLSKDCEPPPASGVKRSVVHRDAVGRSFLDHAAPGGGTPSLNRAGGKSSKLVAPGLLEGDGGFASTGPAGTGTPRAGGGGGVAAPSIVTTPGILGTPRGGGSGGGGLH